MPGPLLVKEKTGGFLPPVEFDRIKLLFILVKAWLRTDEGSTVGTEKPVTGL